MVSVSAEFKGLKIQLNFGDMLHLLQDGEYDEFADMLNQVANRRRVTGRQVKNQHIQAKRRSKTKNEFDVARALFKVLGIAFPLGL